MNAGIPAKEKQKICLLIHGLKDERATGLLRLQEHLESAGYVVRVASYGWFMVRGLVAWWAFNMPVARLLAATIELLDSLGHEVVCVAHSNGATIAMKASELGAPFRAVVLVNGAVERNVKVGTRTGIVMNCRVPSDPVLALSWVIAPLSPWAALDASLGNAGVKPNSDPRMWDIDLTETFGITGHGGFFAPENVPVTGPWLVKALKWATGQSRV